MINRQRKRVLNIIRCHKNVEVLNLVKSEQVKIENLKRELLATPNPEFIRYSNEEVYIADGFTNYQALKIELEALMWAIEKAKVNFKDYHGHLDLLLSQINAINSNNRSIM